MNQQTQAATIEPSVPAAEPAAEGAVNEWEDMADSIDGVVVPKPAAIESAVEDETPPAETPAEEPTPTEVEAPVVEEPAPVTVSPEEQQARYDEYVHQRTADLQEAYAINDEDAAGLLTEPEKVLPRLAANMHIRLEQQVAQMVDAALKTAVPSIISNVAVSTKRETEAKETFFKRWPELRGQEQAVLAAGKFFRAANPTAKPEEAVERIGQMVMLSLGKAPQTQQTQKPLSPARPAGQGGARGAIPNQTSDNEWENMSLEIKK